MVNAMQKIAYRFPLTKILKKDKVHDSLFNLADCNPKDLYNYIFLEETIVLQTPFDFNVLKKGKRIDLVGFRSTYIA
jgi:hypothetical protein